KSCARSDDVHDKSFSTMHDQMISVALRAAGQPGAERRSPAFEIRTRAAHAVGINDHAGVAVGNVLAAHRRHDGLIVDTGVGHQDAERLERSNYTALQIKHPGLLL